jgi:hypothetical protein
MSEQEEIHINVTSGVSLFTREGFCVIEVNHKPVGQLTPQGVRDMAMGWLSAADAAESDAAVFAELTDPKGLNLSDEMAGRFVFSLRARRDQGVSNPE